MAQKDSRRLFAVVPYLYPDLIREKDWNLYNKGQKEGTQLKWRNKDIAPPTDKELFDAKEGALIQYWWESLRLIRNKFLKQSDFFAFPDRPNIDEWLSYRKKLRDFPKTVNPPSFEVLNNSSVRDILNNITNSLPTKPN